MTRKLILLNLALVALAAGLVWLLRARYFETQAHEREVMRRAALAKAVLAPPPAIAPPPVAAAEYLDVAQRTLFSKDRNPNVVIQAPPPAPPPPPMPALPHYHGQMTIGDPVVFLSLDSAPVQKSYRAGDKIGPFQVVSWDREKITLDWDGKTVEKKLEELVVKQAAPPPPQQQAAAAQPAAQAGQGARALGAATPEAAADKKPSVLGNDSGAGFFSCVAGENSPSGTVVDGYKKIVTRGIFGEVCHWEQVK